MDLSLKDLMENVRVGERTVFDVTGDAKDRKLTVELRRLQPEEARAQKRLESPPRRHEFLSAESLAEYLAKYGTKDTVVFADPESQCISAVLDEVAKGGFEVVTMKPQVHPLWKPWAEAAGKRLSLADFADFVAQNRRSITVPNGKELAMMLSQVRASISVEVQRGRGKDAVNGLVITTRIQGKDTKDTAELPDELVVEVPLYVDTKQQAIDLDLCIEADTAGGVWVRVSSGTVLQAKVEAFQEMVKIISEKTKAKGVTTTFGKPSHADWKYLKELEPVPFGGDA